MYSNRLNLIIIILFKKGTQNVISPLNQRQYSNRAQALMNLIKQPNKTPTTIPSTNLPESRPNNGASTVKN